jgi:hypothetical protein
LNAVLLERQITPVFGKTKKLEIGGITSSSHNCKKCERQKEFKNFHGKQHNTSQTDIRLMY